MKTWKGKRIIVFWTDKARFVKGYDWPSFLVLDETDEGIFCQGVDSPNGSKHDGSKVFLSNDDIADLIEWKKET